MNTETLLFKVLVSVIYFIIDKYICLHCLCLQQENLCSQIKSFNNVTFYDISRIVFPWVFVNIMSCHGFSQEEKTIPILICRRNLVTYCLSKKIVILDHESDNLKNVSDKMKKLIHSINKNYIGYAMMCNIAIPYAVKTLIGFTSIITCLVNVLKHYIMKK